MNKRELIEVVSEKVMLPRKEVELVVDAMLESMAKELVAGGEVKLSGFGVLDIRERRARKGTNPQNSKPINIPAAKAVGFKASKDLKERLNK